MKKNNTDNIVIKHNESKQKRLEFINFLVSYFIEYQMSEVNLKYEKFSEEFK